MISFRNNFIFVHIGKTAGNAVQGVLKNYSEDAVVVRGKRSDGVERFNVRHSDSELRKHSTLSEYKRELAPEFFASATKFAVVRNSWDRMISSYFADVGRPIYIKGEPPPEEKKFVPKLFVRRVQNMSRVSRVATFCCLSDDGGKPLPLAQHSMNRFLRFENLQKDFDDFAPSIGVEPTVIVQRNISYHKPYHEYYTNELRDMVGELFADEISYFGFQFGQSD